MYVTNRPQLVFVGCLGNVSYAKDAALNLMCEKDIREKGLSVRYIITFPTALRVRVISGYLVKSCMG